MIPLNYHHLYYFFVTAKAGSVSKACEQLLLAQSTVSAQLKQLEAHLGRRLFERRDQRLHLTDDGRMVLDYAESIFALGRELQDTLRDRPPGGRQLLQLGMLNGIPEVFTHALMLSVLEREPLAHISVQEGPLEWLLQELDRHRLDLVLADAPIQQRSRGAYSSQLVGKISVKFVAAPALAKRYRRFPRDFDGAPLILPMVPSQVYHQVQTFFAEHAVALRMVAEVQDVEVARRLALSGRGITALNVHTLSASLPAGGLVTIGGRMPVPIYEMIYLVSAKRKRLNPLAEHLLKTFHIPSTNQ
jgi:LysR family transcriptional activator of nhaA